MFKRVEALLQKHKIKSIVHETFVMVAVDNLLMLRTFLRDYLRSFDKEQNEPGTYWPCVCVVADRNNLNFNTDLPKKIGLQWDNLMPDFPYISYRNAYLLGDGFTVRDLRFTGEQASMDSWCNVLLDENSISARSIPLLMAGGLPWAAAGPGAAFIAAFPAIRRRSAPRAPISRAGLKSGTSWRDWTWKTSTRPSGALRWCWDRTAWRATRNCWRARTTRPC